VLLGDRRHETVGAKPDLGYCTLDLVLHLAVLPPVDPAVSTD
jgi:hypothetical protein